MIEFKGDCGHLIRARAEDVGKVVRCSYCGKEATVVRAARADDPEEDLLDAVEQTGVFDADVTKVQRRSHRDRKRAEKRLAAGKPATVDPFAVILRMTYVAVIVVIGAVAFKYAPGLYESLVPQSQPSPSPTTDPFVASTPPHERTPAPTLAPQRHGLLTERLDVHPDGAYISSVPKKGLVFHVPQWNALTEIFVKDEARHAQPSNTIVKLKPGRHTIAVAVRINDAALMRLTGYKELRRALEASTSDDAAKRMAAYFVPDDAIAQRLVKIGRHQYIARVYEIEVQDNWAAVTALFLPRRPLAESMTYLPTDITYAFDRTDVERELRFYEVPDNDCNALLDALARVGRMCYRQSEDQRYRMFQIDPTDGVVTSEALDY